MNSAASAQQKAALVEIEGYVKGKPILRMFAPLYLGFM